MHEEFIKAADEMLDKAPVAQQGLDGLSGGAAPLAAAVASAMQLSAELMRMPLDGLLKAHLLAAATQVTVKRVQQAIRAQAAAPSLN